MAAEQTALKPIEPNTGPLHFYYYGNTGKTACGLYVWVNCEPECANCSHRENRATDCIWDVTCKWCRLDYVKTYGIDNAIE